MEEKRQTNNSLDKKKIIVDIALLLFIGGAVYFFSFLKGGDSFKCLRNLIMSVILYMTGTFVYRKAFFSQKLDYNNNDYYFRFYIFYLISFFFCILCSFLPTGAWPFIPVFLLLSLFSNSICGLVNSINLLTMSILISDAGISVFVLYFVCGIFTVCLFNHLDDEIKIAKPVFLTELCLLVCMMANLILIANERPGIEMFILPFSNMIISGILIFAILKLFFAKVVFYYRDRYLCLNDPESELMQSLKNDKKDDYYLSIHSAYFCERIAKKLGLNIEACKCAGLYFILAADEDFIIKNNFPPEAREVLLDNISCNKYPTKKETVILRMCSKLVESIKFMQAKYPGQPIDYDKIIDATFKYFDESSLYIKSDISMREISVCKNTFKEEKLYYDFLR